MLCFTPALPVPGTTCQYKGWAGHSVMCRMILLERGPDRCWSLSMTLARAMLAKIPTMMRIVLKKDEPSKWFPCCHDEL